MLHACMHVRLSTCVLHRAACSRPLVTNTHSRVRPAKPGSPVVLLHVHTQQSTESTSGCITTCCQHIVCHSLGKAASPCNHTTKCPFPTSNPHPHTQHNNRLPCKTPSSQTSGPARPSRPMISCSVARASSPSCAPRLARRACILKMSWTQIHSPSLLRNPMQHAKRPTRLAGPCKTHCKPPPAAVAGVCKAGWRGRGGRGAAKAAAGGGRTPKHLQQRSKRSSVSSWSGQLIRCCRSLGECRKDRRVAAAAAVRG